MVELKSLNLQLENLKVLHEDAIANGFSVTTIKLWAQHIKEVEKAIEEHKIQIEKKDGFNEPLIL